MTDGKITALEVQKRNKERVNVYIDGEFAFGLNMMDAAALRKGQILTPVEVTRLQHGDAVVKAVDAAANFLSYRPRSTTEVRRNLTKKYDPEVVEAAMQRLVDLNYLDDRAFARFWVENRITFKPRSPMALSLELRQKGVPDDIIREATADVDVDEAAYQAAKKRLRRHRGGTFADFERKLGGFLQRRGFRYDTIREVLNRLQNELAETEPDFFAAEDTH